MTDTANLGLPCIEGSQAQKHVTHNDALRILDTLVQLAVADRDLTVPPGAPTEGQRWIVKAGATGLWAGHDNAVAAWQDGAWQYSTPQIGWIAFVADEGTLLVWNGTAWGDFFSTVTSIQNLALLGIGTTADTTNVLAAKLNDVLFAAKTVAEGGSGDLRTKLSKESVAKTLSLLFQDNYSGRAEIGLCGDDDFHFKVSPDGSTWYEGIKIAAATGAVTFPNTTIAGGRTVLTANRTYYVRIDGNNSNNGLTNTSGGAWLTPQRAMDVIVGTLDVAGFTVTVQLGDGTYTSGVTLKCWVGGGTIIFQGNNATPGNVVISATSADAFVVNGTFLGTLTIKDMKLTTATSGYCIRHNGAGLLQFQNLQFGACAEFQIAAAAPGAYVVAIGDYTINGSAGYHMVASETGANITVAGKTVTLAGTPAFSGSFALASVSGSIRANGNTYSGSATGSRYLAQLNGVVYVNGASASYLPGNSAGSTATGGQYA